MIEGIVALVALAVIALPVAILLVGLVWVLRLQRSGALQRGLLHLVFLAERRRVMVRYLTFMVVAFMFAGIVGAIAVLTPQPDALADLLSFGGYLAGALAFWAWMHVALRPAPFTPAQRREAADSVPLMLFALGVRGVVEAEAEHNPWAEAQST